MKRLRVAILSSFQCGLRQHRFAAILASALSTVAGLLLLVRELPPSLFSYDLLFVMRSLVWQPAIPQDAVIVFQDNRSYSELKQEYDSEKGRKAWDRRLYALLIQRLTMDGARSITFDFHFANPSPLGPSVDQQLAQVMRWSQRVVLGVDLDTYILPDGSEQRSLLNPIEPLRQVGARQGMLKIAVQDDHARRLDTSLWLDEFGDLLTLAGTAAQLHASATGQPILTNVHGWLNYYGPAYSIPHVSFADALRPGALPAGFFKDKSVFVGQNVETAAPGTAYDWFRGPFSWWDGHDLPGVEVHATAFLNLIQRSWLRRLPVLTELTILLVVGVFGGIAFAGLRPKVASWTFAVLVAGLAGSAFIAFVSLRVWYAWLIPAAIQLPLIYAVSVSYNSVRLFREKLDLEFQNRTLDLQRQKLALETDNLKLQTRNLELEKETLALQKENLRKSLSLHVPEARVRQFMDRPELLRPGVERATISVLFSDIENFSKFSETLPPVELAGVLNKYYETTLACVHENDGTVVKLIGDAIFAIWNAPLPQPNHHELACRAALMLADRLDEIGTRRLLPMRTRVGIHTGLASVGNIGSTERFDYTAIGESVNLASRLEGLNKHLHTQVLASIDLLREVRDTMPVVHRSVGTFKFKGFGRSVQVFELLGGRPTADDPRSPWLRAFEDGLIHFHGRRFDEAAASFLATIEQRQRTENQQSRSREFRTEDGPSRFYLELIDRYRSTPPGSDWIGEVNLDEK